ncbi:MAG: hypothetical protein V4702_00325 [Patescibacteria group bacterium]
MWLVSLFAAIVAFTALRYGVEQRTQIATCAAVSLVVGSLVENFYPILSGHSKKQFGLVYLDQLFTPAIIFAVFIPFFITIWAIINSRKSFRFKILITFTTLLFFYLYLLVALLLLTPGVEL